MPYVFKEELAEGETAAEVFSLDEKKDMQDRIDELELQALESEDGLNSLRAERDELAGQLETVKKSLDDAKKKFANAFLSSPQQAKSSQGDDVKKDSKGAVTLSQLFNERTQHAD